MGRSVVYCPICGGPFQDVSTGPSEGDDREDVLPPTHTEWLASFRIIGKAASTESQNKDKTFFAISLPATKGEYRCVYRVDTDLAASGWRGRSATSWPVYIQNVAGVLLYRIHDACILFMLKIAHLNLQRAKPGSPAKHTSLESYYETLIRLHEGLKFPYDECFDDEQNMYAPWRLNYGCHKLEWDHGYYGAARFADGSTGNIEPGWEWIFADFINIPGLTFYILRHLQPLQDTGPPRQPSQSQHSIDSLGDTASVPSPMSMCHKSTVILESLPNEIIKQIVSTLPVTATLTLRCCSKSLASKVSLDQLFWRDGLIAGDLVSWLWDLDIKECHAKDRSGSWDWKQLAQTLRQAKIFESALKESVAGGDANRLEEMIIDNIHDTDVSMRDAPLGLQNRCRLAKLVKYIESC